MIFETKNFSDTCHNSILDLRLLLQDDWQMTSSLFEPKRFSHFSHAKLLIPSWITLICLPRLFASVNCRPQSSHGHFNSSWTVWMCSICPLGGLNLLSHISHLISTFPWTLSIWWFRADLVANFLLNVHNHNVHLCE